jgi:hypothetical protein
VVEQRAKADIHRKGQWERNKNKQKDSTKTGKRPTKNKLKYVSKTKKTIFDYSK